VWYNITSPVSVVYCSKIHSHFLWIVIDHHFMTTQVGVSVVIRILSCPITTHSHKWNSVNLHVISTGTSHFPNRGNTKKNTATSFQLSRVGSHIWDEPTWEFCYKLFVLPMSVVTMRKTYQYFPTWWYWNTEKSSSLFRFKCALFDTQWTCKTPTRVLNLRYVVHFFVDHGFLFFLHHNKFCRWYFGVESLSSPNTSVQ